MGLGPGVPWEESQVSSNQADSQPHRCRLRRLLHPHRASTPNQVAGNDRSDALAQQSTDDAAPVSGAAHAEVGDGGPRRAVELPCLTGALIPPCRSREHSATEGGGAL